MARTRRSLPVLTGGLGGVFVALAAMALWLGANHAGLHTREVVSDLAFIVAPSIAAVCCWTAGRRSNPWCGGWRWVGVGCLTWAGASVIWAFYELVLGQYAPFPSYADIPFTLYAVPMVIGLLRFPRLRSGWWSTLRLSMDTLVIVATLLYGVAILLLEPVLNAPHQSVFATLDAVGYPLADVSIAAVVIARCALFSSTRKLGRITLMAGLLVLSGTDSLYVSRTVHGGYAPGTLLDLGWVLAFAAIAVAARVPVQVSRVVHDPDTAPPPTLVQQLLPYAPIVFAGCAAMTQGADEFRSGRFVWVSVAVGLLVAVRQVVVVADHVALTRDLHSAVKKRTGELERREQWWRELVRNLSDIIVVLDPRGQVSYCSPSVEAALGHWPKHLTTGEQLRNNLVHPDDVAGVLAHITPVIQGRQRQGFLECRVRLADDTWGWFEITAVGQLGEQVLDGAVLTLHDVTERRRLTEELSHQAFHDSLTGLPNRAHLMQRIEAQLARGDRSDRLALLLIDLDDFKYINDTHGHQAGDAVLSVIGERLQQAVRASDTVARLGGDEFAILMTGACSDVDFVAHRLVDAVERPVFADGRRFVVHASVGIVYADSRADESPESLLAHADIALYEAKARDKGGIVIIEGDERAAAAQQVHLREQIAQPDLSDFRVVYQPLVDVMTGEMRGVEALLRWRHPELGEISPATFIPLAEHGGSIATLGWFVLETACRQLAEWAAPAAPRLAMGVNVSILQLHEPGFVARVIELIDMHHLDHDQLVLEITEQSLAHDFEIAVGVVSQLREAGVSVAVDDFGTGYSSLRYLHRFAADVVKIDRSFIANLSGSAHTQKLVRSVIEMAKSLELQSIAEGIETPRQLQIVQALGCEIAQGYLFSRPAEPQRIAELIGGGPLFDASSLDPTTDVPLQRSEELHVR
jgi:diguanylate cyclase (GGDEF)-like protein/PAS domain S-box-containing protein